MRNDATFRRWPLFYYGVITLWYATDGILYDKLLQSLPVKHPEPLEINAPSSQPTGAVVFFGNGIIRCSHKIHTVKLRIVTGNKAEKTRFLQFLPGAIVNKRATPFADIEELDPFYLFTAGRMTSDDNESPFAGIKAGMLSWPEKSP
jgi:hypothetical protein